MGAASGREYGTETVRRSGREACGVGGTSPWRRQLGEGLMDILEASGSQELGRDLVI